MPFASAILWSSFISVTAAEVNTRDSTNFSVQTQWPGGWGGQNQYRRTGNRLKDIYYEFIGRNERVGESATGW